MMTSGDWIELLTSSQSNAMAAFALLLTILSGYTVIAYVVGAKLIRSQLAIATTLYFASSILVLINMRVAMIEAQRARYYLTAQLEEFEYANMLSLPQLLVFADVITLMIFSLVLAPLVFMWQVRHPKIQ
jgi:hypothetical protein